MKKVLIIVESRRKDSFPLQLARISEGMLKGEAEASYLHYADLTFMNQNIEFRHRKVL